MSPVRLTRLSLFTAAALLLHTIELALPAPLPLPGVRWGLSNIVLLLALRRFRFVDIILLSAVRISLSALFAGQATVLFYSVSGAACFLPAAFLLSRVLPEGNLPLLSALTSLAHMAGQFAAAFFVLGTPVILAWFPYMAAASLATGALSGIAALLLTRRLPKQFPTLRYS